MIIPRTLTDFEVAGLQATLSLADGHAYQDLSPEFANIIAELPTLWAASEHTLVPDAEQRFRHAFASLAGSPAMGQRRFFKVCPSASSSIDVIGAVLAALRLPTCLVEPTFDNLPLLLRRRGVVLDVVQEADLHVGKSMQRILCSRHGALFLVQPNNPTGERLSADALRDLAEHCRRQKILLVLDNSFRFYHRQPYDDYAVLAETGVRFIAFEDTGKVWPTHDLKASLLFCSPDLEKFVNDIYSETYLCNSRFTLALLTRFMQQTSEVGIARTIWATVDAHRAALRNALATTGLTVEPASLESRISVEWLNCRATGFNDFELTERLAAAGLVVLPGRLFFWHSAHLPERQYNIRIALMKPAVHFKAAVAALANAVSPQLTPITDGKT
jgi:aspartate/methionine/tyrosine aminotransferase